MKKLISAILLIVFVLSFASCQKAADVDRYYDYDISYPSTNGFVTEDSASKDFYAPSNPDESNSGGVVNGEEPLQSSTATDYSKKIIKYQDLVLETLDYPNGVKIIETTVAKYGGYLSSSKESSGGIYNSYQMQSAYYEIRVPAEALEAFVNEIKENFNVRNSTLRTTEVTETYYNLAAKLESLMLQEERLVALMEKADNLKDLITLDDKLTSVRSDINYISSQIQYYDKSVSMSYVNITLQEVKQYVETKEPTFFERVGKAISNTGDNFVSFIEGLFIVIIYVFPFALLAGAVVVLLIIVIKRKNKKSKKIDSENNEANK